VFEITAHGKNKRGKGENWLTLSTKPHVEEPPTRKAGFRLGGSLHGEVPLPHKLYDKSVKKSQKGGEEGPVGGRFLEDKGLSADPKETCQDDA